MMFESWTNSLVSACVSWWTFDCSAQLSAGNRPNCRQQALYLRLGRPCHQESSSCHLLCNHSSQRSDNPLTDCCVSKRHTIYAVPEWFNLHFLVCLQDELSAALTGSDDDPLWLLAWLLHISIRHALVKEQHLPGVRPHVQRFFLPCERVRQIVDNEIVLTCSEDVIDGGLRNIC